MSLLRRNVVANLGGKVVTALTGLVVVPFYQRYLGLEAYGLISFFVTLNAVIAVFDLGLSMASNREIGVLTASASDRGGQEAGRRLLRTMEGFYFMVAGALFIGFLATADFWATRWIRAQGIPLETIHTCVVLAGGTIALRWPVALYTGILMGLERQVLANGIAMLVAVVKAAGSIAVVALVSSSPVVFYQWQVAAGVVETACMALAAWGAVGGLSPWRIGFDWRLFRSIWRFGANIGGITIFAMVLKQLDKLIISKVLPLDQLGYYNTAWLAAAGVSLLFQPVQAAVFPRFNKMVAQSREAELEGTFHRAATLVAFAAAPAAAGLAFFSYEILELWTRSAEVARQAGLSLSLLGGAALFNGMMAVPFALQLAAGLSWLPLANNILAVLFMAPAILFLVAHFGIAGGAAAWLIYNAAYYTLLPQFMFRRVLPRAKRSWYFADTLPFMVLATGLCAGARWVWHQSDSFYTQAAAVAVATALYALASLAGSRILRSMIVPPMRRMHAAWICRG